MANGRSVLDLAPVGAHTAVILSREGAAAWRPVVPNGSGPTPRQATAPPMKTDGCPGFFCQCDLRHCAHPALCARWGRCAIDEPAPNWIPPCAPGEDHRMPATAQPCPTCGAGLPADALAYLVAETGRWFTICVNCGERFLVELLAAPGGSPYLVELNTARKRKARAERQREQPSRLSSPRPPRPRRGPRLQ